MKFGIGQPVRREEDRRLLTGGGRYTDDINLPGQAWAVIVRAPYAGARIRGIDAAEAAAQPGVLAVYTGEDVAAAGLGTLPCLVPKIAPQKRPDGAPMYVPPRPLLVRERVAFVGDYVAMVVAETRNAARDAAELVDVDYEPLPANVEVGKALEAPPVWDDCPDNISFQIDLGDRAATDAAFAAAAHVVSTRIPITRVAMNPMEPRAAVGDYDAEAGRYTIYSGHQFPHDFRRLLAEDVLKVPESAIRVVSPDMGGAFGLRAQVFPELVLVLWAARQLGCPVKWLADRSEGFLADDHGRDMQFDVSLALDAAGKFLGLRVDSLAAMGAYLGLFGPFPSFGNMGGIAGVYTTPAIHARVRAVFTNATPIGPYRGAGRPEASLAIEQVIDMAARELGIDRVELRRRNLIPPEAMPYQTALTYHYDCGEFERNMDRAAELGDVAGFAARRDAAAAAGKLRGLGIVNTIEQAAGLFDEGADITFAADGSATVAVGTHGHGQGHETMYKQILAEALDLPFSMITFVQGDTDAVPYGHGTGGSRSSGLGGSAVWRAAEVIVDKGRAIAGHLLETATADVDFADGHFRVVGTDREVSLAEVAAAAHDPARRPPEAEPGLQAFATFAPEGGPTFPNGTHVCEVEIDPETGVVRIVRYVVISDVGTVLNPLMLAGQMHGGVVQGLGQVFLERITWDDGGQLLTGSFLDYAMPRADDVPPIELESLPVPTAKNPLGVKGAGESGTVGALPAAINAIIDALAPLGVRDFTMPATPERVWRAIRDAEGR
jgi:carbon-monoxide dehydrogenase large subunit